MLLTADVNGYTEGVAFLRSLTPGEVVTISFTTPDPSWSQVTEAIGAYYSLVENGVAKSDFEVSAAPRTAVGVKASGEVVLGELSSLAEEASGRAAAAVVEPPPSRHRAVTQPSSTIRWASTPRDAPMLTVFCRPSRA